MFKKIISEPKEIPAFLNSSYLPSLDGLRAVAVLIVILAHLNERVFHNHIIDTVFPFGNLGVYIFFVLSGFLITTLLLKEKVSTGSISLTEFYRRRFFRIIPVAYLFLLVAILLKYVFNLPVSLQEMAMGFLFLRALDGTINTNSPTAHFWSLSYEEQYYIMYPFLLKKSIKFFLAVIALVVGLQFVFLIPTLNNLINFPGEKIVYQLFVRSFDGLAIGSFFAILVFHKIIQPDVPVKYLTFINILLVVGFTFIHALNLDYRSVFSSILIAFFIVLNIHPNNKTIFYTVLNSKPLVYIGKLSYSLYIWQQIFTMCIPWSGQFPYADAVWLNLILLFIVAYCSYNFYEKFFLRFKYKK